MKKYVFPILIGVILSASVAFATQLYFSVGIENDNSGVQHPQMSCYDDGTIVLEGDTPDAYETTIQIVDPTADRTYYVPNYTGASVISTLTTNAPDVVNSVWGGTNQWIFEGATADGIETIITPTDPTSSDKTVTIPNQSGAMILSPAGVADATNAISGGTGTFVWEGATADGYETTLAVTDPTGDRTITAPDLTGTIGLILGTGASVAVPSTLATNGVDVANSVWSGTNQFIFEGATANDYETIFTPTDATADRTVTIPNLTGTLGLILGTGASVSVPSTLATNGVDVVNSVWGGTNQYIMEGATADDYETVLTPTDATADRTQTLQNADGIVVLDVTACTDLEGDGLAITTAVLNLSPAEGGFKMPFNFYQTDATGSQTAVALAVLGLAGNTEYTMPYAGSVMAISVASNDARTAGTVTVDATVNGTATGLQAVLNATDTTYAQATQAQDADAFSAGGRLGVKITTSADWTPVTADVVVTVLCEQ